MEDKDLQNPLDRIPLGVGSFKFTYRDESNPGTVISEFRHSISDPKLQSVKALSELARAFFPDIIDPVLEVGRRNVPGIGTRGFLRTKEVPHGSIHGSINRRLTALRGYDHKDPELQAALQAAKIRMQSPAFEKFAERAEELGFRFETRPHNFIFSDTDDTFKLIDHMPAWHDNPYYDGSLTFDPVKARSAAEELPNDRKTQALKALDELSEIIKTERGNLPPL